MARLTQARQSSKNEYDPTKSYKWDPEDIIELTGQQFGVIVSMLEVDISTPGGAPINMKIRAYDVITSIIKMGVEAGLITENAPKEQYEEKVRSLFDNQNTQQNEV